MCRKGMPALDIWLSAVLLKLCVLIPSSPTRKAAARKILSAAYRLSLSLTPRVVIEHVNRRLKVFRILSQRYRNRRKRNGKALPFNCWNL